MEATTNKFVHDNGDEDVYMMRPKSTREVIDKPGKDPPVGHHPPARLQLHKGSFDQIRVMT